jgi:hypothetical protein
MPLLMDGMLMKQWRLNRNGSGVWQPCLLMSVGGTIAAELQCRWAFMQHGTSSWPCDDGRWKKL